MSQLIPFAIDRNKVCMASAHLLGLAILDLGVSIRSDLGYEGAGLKGWCVGFGVSESRV